MRRTIATAESILRSVRTPATRQNCQFPRLHNGISRKSATSSTSFITQIAVLAGGALIGAYASSFFNNGKKNAKAAPGSTTSLENMPIARYNLTESNLRGAQEELTSLLTSERVTDDLGTRIAHSSTEWSPAPNGDLDRPTLVVYPLTTEDVSGIAKICHKRRIPMIAFSGGTSLEGTLAMTTQGGVCIDFSRMNKVLALHKADLDVVVQPGVGYEDLNSQLAKEGLFFPPDPGPGAQIGGMISQGCSGTNAYRYGTMKDWVLGLTIVLADGSVVKTRHRPRKSSAGYNLTQLIVASEGTLGLVTEASLKLTGKPEVEKVAVASFPTTHKAVETVLKIVQNDLPVAAIELLDDVTMGAVNKAGYCDKEYPEIPTLFFKFSGPENVIKEQIKKVTEFAKQSACKSFEFSKTADQAASLWQARKTALWSLLAIKEKPEDNFLSADVCVPISQMADIIEETHTKLEESGLVGSCLGHVGDGNFHTTVLYGEHDKKKARELIKWVQKRGIEMDGTISGEHGIGLENRDMLCNELGMGYIDAMRHVKLALDPLCLLNPDKIFQLKFEIER
ncbi:FAD-binding domain-containing protein [Rhizodiscina lignyota]|uniref:FAD-binding domain-containing protein n=1 Tax=Rhizodiscina lignyota TaxID=1504668 RepID=A0A9P4ITF8_9PEZI|nr:FAD-binding domain-containing protein [Rhizodiscina lignyota]